MGPQLAAAQATVQDCKARRCRQTLDRWPSGAEPYAMPSHPYDSYLPLIPRLIPTTHGDAVFPSASPLHEDCSRRLSILDARMLLYRTRRIALRMCMARPGHDLDVTSSLISDTP
eukprot:360927-Chlamydomonas_euryale.AAC.3